MSASTVPGAVLLAPISVVTGSSGFAAISIQYCCMKGSESGSPVSMTAFGSQGARKRYRMRMSFRRLLRKPLTWFSLMSAIHLIPLIDVAPLDPVRLPERQRHTTIAPDGCGLDADAGLVGLLERAGHGRLAHAPFRRLGRLVADHETGGDEIIWFHWLPVHRLRGRR